MSSSFGGYPEVQLRAPYKKDGSVPGLSSEHRMAFAGLNFFLYTTVATVLDGRVVCCLGSLPQQNKQLVWKSYGLCWGLSKESLGIPKNTKNIPFSSEIYAGTLFERVPVC